MKSHSFSSPMQGLIADDAHAVDISVSYALLWLSVADGELNAEQQLFLEDYLANITKCLQHRELFFQMLEKNDAEAIALVSEVLSNKLTADEKHYFLEQAIQLTSYKKNLSISTNHILRFFADLFSVDSKTLLTNYRGLTQKSLGVPGDPSRIVWWEGADSQQLLTPEEITARFSEDRLTETQARQVLGVSDTAQAEEIKQAYRRLTQQYHPDRATASSIDADVAKKMFALARRSFEVLKA